MVYALQPVGLSPGPAWTALLLRHTGRLLQGAVPAQRPLQPRELAQLAWGLFTLHQRQYHPRAWAPELRAAARGLQQRLGGGLVLAQPPMQQPDGDSQVQATPGEGEDEGSPAERRQRRRWQQQQQQPGQGDDPGSGPRAPAAAAGDPAGGPGVWPGGPGDSWVVDRGPEVLAKVEAGAGGPVGPLAAWLLGRPAAAYLDALAGGSLVPDPRPGPGAEAPGPAPGREALDVYVPQDLLPLFFGGGLGDGWEGDEGYEDGEGAGEDDEGDEDEEAEQGPPLLAVLPVAWPSQAWLHALARACHPLLPAFGARELGLTLWALLGLGYRPPAGQQWLQPWLRRAARVSGDLRPANVASLACAMVACGELPEEVRVAGALRRAALRAVPDAQPRELRLLMQALAALAARPGVGAGSSSGSTAGAGDAQALQRSWAALVPDELLWALAGRVAQLAPLLGVRQMTALLGPLLVLHRRRGVALGRQQLRQVLLGHAAPLAACVKAVSRRAGAGAAGAGGPEGSAHGAAMAEAAEDGSTSSMQATAEQFRLGSRRGGAALRNLLLCVLEAAAYAAAPSPPAAAGPDQREGAADGSAGGTGAGGAHGAGPARDEQAAALVVPAEWWQAYLANM